MCRVRVVVRYRAYRRRVAKILGTVVGLDHFDRHYEGGQLHPVVPSDIETVHLCELGPEPWN